MALDTRLKVSASAKLSNTLDLATASAELAKDYPVTLATGTGAGQADLLWSDQRTIAASSSEDLDLAGSLVGPLGTTLTFARIKGLIVAAASTNSNNVVVGNATSNGWVSWVGGAAHTVTVRPGGLLALFAPDAIAYAVTAATADLLKIANSGAGSTVTYDIIVIGASA